MTDRRIMTFRSEAGPGILLLAFHRHRRPLLLHVHRGAGNLKRHTHAARNVDVLNSPLFNVKRCITLTRRNSLRKQSSRSTKRNETDNFQQQQMSCSQFYTLLTLAVSGTRVVETKLRTRASERIIKIVARVSYVRFSSPVLHNRCTNDAYATWSNRNGTRIVGARLVSDVSTCPVGPIANQNKTAFLHQADTTTTTTTTLSLPSILPEFTVTIDRWYPFGFNAGRSRAL